MKIAHARAMILIVISLLLAFSSIGLVFSNESSGMMYGLNYSSAYWHYQTPSSTVHRDFALFQENDIKLICLCPHWNYLEPIRGNYRTTYLDDLVRVCDIAGQYNIQVIIDFHTLMNQGYGVPGWISPNRFATIIKQSSAKQAWLNMLDYAVGYLDSKISNLHSWHMMNEPLTESSQETTEQMFIDLWKYMAQVFRENSNKPISIRFGCWSFNSYWKQQSEMYEILDYITLNWYRNKGESVLLGSLQAVRKAGKEAMIGEYGLGTWDDGDQEDSYRYQLELFKSNGIRTTLAWHYGDYIGGQGFNLIRNNVVRPAFDVLVQYNELPIEPETPPTVVSHIPGDGQTDVSVDTTIQVTFSEPMDQLPTQVAFSIDPTVSGSFGWNPESTVMAFTPASFLDYEQPYTVTITTAAKDLEGDHMESLDSWIFTTPPPPSISLFEDNFDSADFSKWTGTQTSSGEAATVMDTLPYQGSFHGRFTSNGEGEVEYAYCYRTIDEEEVYARGYFYIASGLPLENNDDRFYFIHLRAGAQYLAGVGIRRHDGSDKWVLYGRNGSGWVGPIYAMSPAIETNRWYCIELHWKKHAMRGIVETYVDGARILVMENIDTARFDNVSEISFGLTQALGVRKSLDVYGDCFAVSDTYIGPSPAEPSPQEGEADIYDVVILALAYGSYPGHPRWDPRADLNGDGIVDIFDLAEIKF